MSHIYLTLCYYRAREMHNGTGESGECSWGVRNLPSRRVFSLDWMRSLDEWFESWKAVCKNTSTCSHIFKCTILNSCISLKTSDDLQFRFPCKSTLAKSSEKLRCQYKSVSPLFTFKLINLRSGNFYEESSRFIIKNDLFVETTLVNFKGSQR